MVHAPLGGGKIKCKTLGICPKQSRVAGEDGDTKVLCFGTIAQLNEPQAPARVSYVEPKL